MEDCPSPRRASWLALALLVPWGSAYPQQKRAAPGAAPGAGPTAEVDPSRLEVAPLVLDFGPVPTGEEHALGVTLHNAGFVPIELRRLRFLLGASGNSAAFRARVNGVDYAGSVSNVARSIEPPLSIGRAADALVTLTFEPVHEQLDAFVLRLETSEGYHDVAVSGLGGHAGDPYLHVAIDGPRWRVDHDGDGSESLFLDGTGSHTHEPGHSLAVYAWRVDGQLASSTTTLATVLTQPETGIELEITDDNQPPRSLSMSIDVRVVEPDQVPGVLAHYHDASASGASALLDAVLPRADFLEQRPSMNLGGTGHVGGSPFTANVLVRQVARLQIDSQGTYTLVATGGAGRRLLVDGAQASGPLFLAAGPHELEARFAVDTLADLPLDVELWSGASGGPLVADLLHHDETDVAPVIHALTPSGLVAGGDLITLEGFGFFPAPQVVVHWGEMDLIAQDFSLLSPERIQFLSPPGGGAIAVSVGTANGESNVHTFLYQLSGPPPIQFRRELRVPVTAPTAGVWAPDGKLYVVSLDGRITALEFDADYELVSRATFPGVSGLSNHESLSLAIDPYAPLSPLRLYVGHGDHFVNGGIPPTGPSPYTGQVSVLTGPGFDAPSARITGLPVSNHDHGINGIVFDDNGDLLVSVGSLTNAGVASANEGGLPESPLSSAVLKARLSKPGFNGAITYVLTQSGLPNDDQRFGESVDVAPGVDVEVHAAGLRNAYGLVLTTKGRLYATDNGPNVGFGPASTGPQSQGADPYDDDELDLIEWGNYYGSPNRSRGRTDPRQNVYYGGFTGPPSVPGILFQMIGWLPTSSDGIDEYRASTFAGQMRGELIVQEYQGSLRRVRLGPDGRTSVGQSLIGPNTEGLGCLTGPGGAIVSLDFEHDEVEILEPNDLTPLERVVHDIFPWRAPAAGGTPFVIAGRGFGTLANTSVTIGGHPALLEEVAWSRIRGWIPAEPDPSPALVDVVVRVGGEASTLGAAFRYLLGPGLEPGRWETLVGAPVALGEVAAGVIGGTLFLVGEGSSGATFAYDVLNRQWLAARAARPFRGSHHAAEVVAGKVYLIGGIGGGSGGRVQIYDPSTDSWSLGADMPWSGGSVSTAVIGGKILAAGGLTAGGSTVSNCASYDPLANTWTGKAPMPGGRNHAAAGTDGSKLFVFGGRVGSSTTNGSGSLMVYDPATNTWTSSGAPGSSLAPLPEARGGMGKAVFLRGEFHLFGGETLDDPDANDDRVYERVDVYDPRTNAWRAEAPMPHPRHGIFPVLFQGHVFLAGGGSAAGSAPSSVFDTFTRQ
jgi:N-acetylneuraminic acid mutarotase